MMSSQLFEIVKKVESVSCLAAVKFRGMDPPLLTASCTSDQKIPLSQAKASKWSDHSKDLQSYPNHKRLKMEKTREISQHGVVQIFVDKKQEWTMQPWTFYSNSSTGSGFIIQKRVIVTNAHVIEHGKNVQVKRQWEGKKYEARILAVIHNVDIALLTVNDESFWTDHYALEISSEPIRLQFAVDVVGYPVGGQTVCITNGVVSRIDWHSYCQSGYSNLCITVDAAINPGNSGGPAVHEGKVVGVAFQSMSSADGIGYIIPASILLIVLEEYVKASQRLADVSAPDVLATDQPLSIPNFGYFDAKIMKLDNPSLQSYYSLPKGHSGVLVTKVPDISWLVGHLRKGDVITEIDGHEIAFDGTVSLAELGRMDFRSILTRKVEGGHILLKIFRERAMVEMDLTIGSHYELLPRHWRGPRAQYIVFAGLVFVPLSNELLEALKVKKKTAGLTYKAEAQVEHEFKWQHIVVISTILPHRINTNISVGTFRLKPLLTVNGRKILHLSDLAAALDECECEYEARSKGNGGPPRDMSSSNDVGAGPLDSGAEVDVQPLEAQQSISETTAPKISELEAVDKSKSWIYFQFGDDIEAAFETTEALAATQDIATEYMLKKTRFVGAVER